MVVTKGSIAIRVYKRDIKTLKKIFPKRRKESMTEYLKRYIDTLRNMEVQQQLE